jgi:AcrR family transcriptional regulator
MLNDVHNSMSASSRRQKQKEELRRAILDAARDIFVRQGYESFSMRKLAEKIEYSPASLYLHFKNKEELFDCLVEESFEHLLKTLMHVEDGPDPVAGLKKGLLAYVDFGLRHPNDYRFAFMLKRPLETRHYKVHAAFDALRTGVKRCIEQKRFRAVDEETACQAIWASVHGITSLLIQRPSFPWVAKKKLIALVIDNAVNYLADIPRTMPTARSTS